MIMKQILFFLKSLEFKSGSRPFSFRFVCSLPQNHLYLHSKQTLREEFSDMDVTL